MECKECGTCKNKQKPTFRMASTEEYDLLNDFFEKNGLEVPEDEEVATDVVKAWKITEPCGEDTLIGGIVLALREGRYIIDGIAVDEKYRKHKLGKILLDKAISEIKVRDGKELYLVARAPGFFATQGFEEIKRESAPQFFECFGCPQYEKTCHPKVMKLVI